MTTLLKAPPFAPRDDAAFLAEMNELCQWHLAGCAEYRRVWPAASAAGCLEDLPFLHVGAFKTRLWRTEAPGITHQRTLLSSSTTGAAPSRILLDQRSSQLQSASSASILRDLLGDAPRPLVVLDNAGSLRKRGEASARIAAAMSLAPLATEIDFLLGRPESPDSMCWDKLNSLLARHCELLVYGFTWMLWQAWASAAIPEDTVRALKQTKVHFVHSGGWKKLEAARVDRHQFDESLLSKVAAGSQVIDYYGLVEQVGVIFPLCEAGHRHVPRWAAVLVRDAWTLEPLRTKPGLLQFMNVLSWGSPHHNVLTEDLGQLISETCLCGKSGQCFDLLGRVPKAEIRGCANA